MQSFIASPKILGHQSALGLYEIVVTARKREGNLQAVGLALSALSKSDTDQQCNRDIMGIAEIAPNNILIDIPQGSVGNVVFRIGALRIHCVEKNHESGFPLVIDEVAIKSHSEAILGSTDRAI